MSGPRKPDEPLDLIGVSDLMRLLEDDAPGDNAPRDADQARDEDDLGTVPVPRMTRMPDGIEVVEQPLGHAVGRWILQVRCECGRRWFEVEAVESATCPRCGSLVLIQVDDGR